MQNFAIEVSRPGVIAIVNAGQVSRPVQRQPSSTFFVVGYSPWGPVNTPTIITSAANYFRTFGPINDNSLMDDALYTFFNIFSGKQSVVTRVVGPGAAVATRSIIDSRGVGALDTLRIDGKYPSSSVDVLVTIEAGTLASTYRLIARSVALGTGREIHDNLKMDAVSMDQVNQKSKLVKITNLTSTAVGDLALPIPTAEVALTGGSDDFASMTVGTYVGTDTGSARTGLQTFNSEEWGGGQVAIPGITTAAAHAALVTHATNWHRLALLDPPLGSDKTAVANIRALYATWYAAIYWPWVKVLDYNGNGLTKYVPPSGFAAGACAYVDINIGTHKAPANIKIPNALDVETFAGGAPQTDDNTRDFLNRSDVNVIAPLRGEGVKIYGARVMTDDRRIAFVHQIRMMNMIYYSAKLAYAWATFSVVDGQGKLFRDLKSAGVNFLRDLWSAGALYGEKEEDAFIVIADSSNNPPSQLELGIVRVQWGVKLSPTAEIIIVNIDNVPLTQQLGVLQ